jgi:hypothetical protein
MNELIHYLQKHPILGFVSSISSMGIPLAVNAAELIAITGGCVGIGVGILTAYAKVLEIKERKANLRKQSDKSQNNNNQQ